MALTPSNMLPLGTIAPAFSLTDTEDKVITLDSFPEARGFLVMFICNHCPYVKHLRPQLAHLTSKYLGLGIAVFAINANDSERYPDDSPEKMKLEKKNWGYKFPYLVDATQSVAKAYDAACTPDFYLFNARRELVYRGQFDSSRPGNQVPVTGEDLAKALDLVLANRPVPVDQIPSVGCNIKWK